MQNRQILWLCLCLPTVACVRMGQVYFLLFFLSAIAWLGLERQTIRFDLLAALAIGTAVAIKPTFLFWPAFLFLQGDRKLALRAIGVTFVLSAVPILLYGPSIYSQWIHGAAVNQQLWRSGENIAIAPYFRRLGLPPLGIALAWTVAAILAWRVWKKTPSRMATTMIALSTSIFCAPLAWVHYTWLLAPGFIWRRWGALSSTAAALLFIPSWIAFFFTNYRVHLGMAVGSTIYFVATWMVMFEFLRTESTMKHRQALS
jgi:hypothetical protein